VASDALLVVSELVTNAIRHGGAPIELRLRHEPHQLVITVSDGAVTLPAPRDMDPTSAWGRGLHLVEAVTDRWGAHPIGAGKTVWAIVPLPCVPGEFLLGVDAELRGSVTKSRQRYISPTAEPSTSRIIVLTCRGSLPPSCRGTGSIQSGGRLLLR
jgi:hypothetical protein